MKTTKGKFYVTGHKFLPLSTRRLIRDELNLNDEVKLEADRTNSYDCYAIKVIFKGEQIGWYEGVGYRKEELFNKLITGVEVKTNVIDLYKRDVARADIRIRFEYALG